jgi:diguanylate cyclase (GGDEF)-like protein
MSNKVLIVTDNAATSRTLKEALAPSSGCALAVESSALPASAIARIHSLQPDLILADVFLADSDGTQAFAQLRQAAPKASVVALCSQTTERFAQGAVQQGAAGYLRDDELHSRLVAQHLLQMLERNRCDESLQLERQRTDVALNAVTDAVIATDNEGKVTRMNAAAETIAQCLAAEALGRPLDEVLNLVDADTGASLEDRGADGSREGSAERPPRSMRRRNAILFRNDHAESEIEASSISVYDRRGGFDGAVLVLHDISAARAMSREMSHLVAHDLLTGLPNRRLFDERLGQCIAMARRRGTQLDVLSLDLDNFKYINDSLGHAVGDRLLQSVGLRLLACAHHSDMVSRQGGDEFRILLSDDKNGEGATVLAEKILSTLAAPHVIDDHELHITASIGISMYPADGADPSTLMQHADTAMYHAKSEGRNTFQFFDTEMNVRAVERQSVESDLRYALIRKEFELYYQPKVNLRTGEITGAEALIRWCHPRRGLLLPDQFVRVAEEAGLISAIGSWALQQACHEAKKWAALKPSISIAVNVSALEFRNKSFVDEVRRILRETGLPPSCLELELTETVLMRNANSSTEVLRELKHMGVRLAVDDFGTGYSSLSYLQRFPIDILKIDQSFVQNIQGTGAKGVIVSAVIGLGAGLRQRVIAEGVETQEQFAFLDAQNCEEGQGFYFSRPLPADQFAALLETGIPPAVFRWSGDRGNPSPRAAVTSATGSTTASGGFAKS